MSSDWAEGKKRREEKRREEKRREEKRKQLPRFARDDNGAWRC
jgi:hypothetical protein